MTTDPGRAVDASVAKPNDGRDKQGRRARGRAKVNGNQLGTERIGAAESLRRPTAGAEGIAFTDFYAHMPSHTYLYIPAREFWPAASIDGRLPRVNDTRPSAWLDLNRPIEQVTWAPAEPELITDRLIQAAGWIEKPGARVFNLYRPPPPLPGDHGRAGPWLDHLERLYPEDTIHIIQWMANRIQMPGVKINHALVVGGTPGIGKDTLLRPLRAGVGPWNVQDVRPTEIMGNFNGFAKCTLLVVSEARDLGEFDRFALYDHMKTLLAEPPPVLRVNEKYARECYVPNVLGAVFTTNHASDALYLPADDRRHYVAWSEARAADFSESYFTNLHDWLNNGGEGHVVEFLRRVDLTAFDPKAPPKKTAAFWRLVATGEAPEAGEMRDVIESLGDPLVLTLDAVLAAARALDKHDLADELGDRKTRRQVPHKFERVGYVPVRNPDAQDGLFKIGGSRVAIYGRQNLPHPELIKAARRMGP